MTEHIFSSAADTQKFCQNFAPKIPDKSVVALIGELGTGKTTFTQGFAKGIGIEDHVISPTFKLVSEYNCNDQILYHIDCYRLNTPEEFLNIDGEHYLNPPRGITIIEWPERIELYWSNDWTYIYFHHIPDKPNSRLIKISGKF